MIMVALIYGARPISIIEKFSSQPHITDQKNASWVLALSCAVYASRRATLIPGTGTFARST